MQRCLFASTQKLDLPDWFCKELTNIQSIQMIMDELPKNIAKLGNNS
jgi:hypothetical protein